MLGKKNSKKEEKSKSKVETILGNKTKITGDIYTKGSLRIEGDIEGNIKAEGDVFVGEKGNIGTEIEARNVVVAGTVSGNITAHEKIEILPSGKIKGDIQTKTLKIDEGAVFTGHSKPLHEKTKNRSSSKAKKEAAATSSKN